MNIKVPENIETENLSLKFVTAKDTESIFGCYAQDTEVSKYLTWTPHKSIDETRRFIQQRLNEMSGKKRYTYALKLKDTNELTGMLSLKFITQFRVSLSYLIVKKQWGNGYGAEAVSAAIKWCLAQPEIFRIEALCEENNDHSARTLLKAGMKREGMLKRTGYVPNINEEPADCYVFSVTK